MVHSVEERREQAVRALRNLSREQQLEVIAETFRRPWRPNVDVDAAPFRERYLVLRARDKNLTADIVAERMGWLFGSHSNGKAPHGDGSRVLRRLGLMASKSGQGSYTVQRHVTYELAVQFADALELDYVDADV